MVHIYNGILLSHKKEHIWVSSNEVDEPRAYYTEWSKSEREKQILYINASLVAQMLKSLPAMLEAWVQSLGQEDPLEKGMATHSNILAWKIPWIEEPGRLQPMGSQRVGHNWAADLSYLIWNLEGWYWWIYSQSSNGDADIENRLMDKGGGEQGEGEMNGESSMDAYTLTYVNRQPMRICCKEIKLGLC